MGVQKFIGDVPIFVILEDNLATKTGIKLGFIEPYLKYITGVLELVAGGLLLFGKRLFVLASHNYWNSYTGNICS